MKRSTYLIIVSQAVLLLLLISRPSSAFAATTHRATPDTHITQSAMNIPMERDRWRPHAIASWHRFRSWRYGHYHMSNQYLHGRCIDSWVTKSYTGNNQSNDGNRGYNGGINQDNSSNDGNQLINQGNRGGNQVHNQYLRGCIGVGNTRTFWGSNQNNDGNGGYNRGFNQDNSGNQGNQIIN